MIISELLVVGCWLLVVVAVFQSGSELVVLRVFPILHNGSNVLAWSRFEDNIVVVGILLGCCSNMLMTLILLGPCSC